tara:strand:- start:162 stop:308 length:147 start_codon:yes stop_codon:yes gene_type:complete
MWLSGVKSNGVRMRLRDGEFATKKKKKFIEIRKGGAMLSKINRNKKKK